MSKAAFRILIALFSAGLLLSQSLVEVSKAEQERREKLKGKNVKVVINADLQSARKTPAIETAAAEPGGKQDAAEGTAAATGEEETHSARGRELRARADVETGNQFARLVLPETSLVETPENALNYPDGRYAEISVSGFLDVDLSVNNKPGPDFSIYAKQAGAKDGQAGAGEEDGMPVMPPGVLGQALWEGFWYGVLVRGESGNWEAIGQGTGKSSPEKFDLGGIAAIKSVRIVFHPLISPGISHKALRSHAQEYTIGIDALEALH